MSLCRGIHLNISSVANPIALKQKPMERAAKVAPESVITFLEKASEVELG